RLRHLGHAACGLPLREPRAARRERRAFLLGGEAAVARRAAGDERDDAARRRRRGGIVLRDPPLTSRIGGVGDRAARRAVRAAVFHLYPALSTRRGRQRPTPTATAGGLGGGLRARDAREVDRHDAAAAPRRP